MPIHVLLHIADGYVSQVNVYRLDGKPIYPRPDVTKFAVLPRDDIGNVDHLT